MGTLTGAEAWRTSLNYLPILRVTCVQATSVALVPYKYCDESKLKPRLLMGGGGGSRARQGFSSGSVRKKPPVSAGDTGDAGSTPGSGRFPWGRKWQPTPVCLPRKFHGQRSLVG